jgi:hypothetical protein
MQANTNRDSKGAPMGYEPRPQGLDGRKSHPMKTLKQLVEEQTLTRAIAEAPSDLANTIWSKLAPEQRQEAFDRGDSTLAGWGGTSRGGLEEVIREVARERGLIGEDTPPEFPFPGARILSLWVGEQVKVQLQMGASTDEILSVVRQVLDDNDKKHGQRPLAATAGGER